MIISVFDALDGAIYNNPISAFSLIPIRFDNK